MKVDNKNVEDFGKNRTSLLPKALQNLNHIPCISNDSQHFKDRKSAIILHFMTLRELVYTTGFPSLVKSQRRFLRRA